MAASPPRPELPEVLAFVREQVAGFADLYSQRGVRVVGIEADSTASEPLPYLIVFLRHVDVEGERVRRYSLDHNGKLLGPGDAGQSIAIDILEITRSEIERLPRSNWEPRSEAAE